MAPLRGIEPQPTVSETAVLAAIRKGNKDEHSCVKIGVRLELNQNLRGKAPGALPNATPGINGAGITKPNGARPFYFGRSGRIRTRDPMLPKQVRYQATLHSD